MATRARRSTPSSRARSRKPATAKALDGLKLPPHVARSLIGLTLIVIGTVTVIALIFPDAGIFNRYVTDLLRPAVGQGAWLLAVLLIVAGVVIERPPKLGYGSTLAVVGGLIVFAAGLGLIHLVLGRGAGPAALSAGGGALGNTLSVGLSDLLSPPGAFVMLLGLLAGGLILMFNVTLRGLLTPVAGGGKKLAGVIAVPARALAVGAADAAKGRSADEQPALRPTGPGKPVTADKPIAPITKPAAGPQPGRPAGAALEPDGLERSTECRIDFHCQDRSCTSRSRDRSS